MPSTERVLAAVGRILRPIARILIRNGIPSDALTQLVRKIYVDVAAAEFQLDGKRQTVSRISVITGLHRKEVARLLAIETAGTDAAVAGRNRAATVLSAWLRDPEFLDRKGDPLELAFAGTNSFSELVRRYSGDMKPRALADELLSAGAIEQAGSRLRMTARGYVPTAADPDELLAMLGVDAAQLIETIDHNLREPEKRFQRKVQYHGVPRDEAPEFRALSARLSQHLLEELDRWLAARLGDGKPTVTIGLGIFQIEQPDDEAPPATQMRNQDHDPR